MILVVFLCMTLDPTQCVERTQPLYGANELTCLTMGQAELARLLTPGWTVKKYGCRRHD